MSSEDFLSGDNEQLSVSKNLIGNNSKFETRDRLIQNFLKNEISGKSNSEKLKFCEQSIVNLCKMILSEEITCLELTKIFLERAYKIGMYKLSAVADIYHEEALEIAIRRDKLLQQTPKNSRTSEKLGKLFGIPLSIKDMIGLKNTLSTCGLIKNTINESFCNQNAPIIDILLKEGAIPFIKSNQPADTPVYESSNPIFGTTKNPFNLTRTAGGTSGGCGALVSSHSSPGSIGTELSGSLRVPAHFCRLYTLKYTESRLSSKGLYTGAEEKLQKHESSLQFTIGPLVKTLEDLILLTRVLFDNYNQKIDSLIDYKPFDDILLKSTKKLKIAYFTKLDHIYPTHPSVIRAVKEVIKICERKSSMFEVVRFDYDLTKLVQTWVDAKTYGSQYEDLLNLISDEYKDYPYLLKLLGKLPNFFTKFFIKRAFRNPERFEKFLSNIGRNDVDYYFELAASMEHQQIDIQKYMKEHQIDLIVCPVAPSMAFQHGSACRQTRLFGLYCGIWNAVKFPAGVMPVTEVSNGEECGLVGCECRDLISEKMLENMVGGTGMPVGVQVIAKPREDELILNFMGRVAGDLSLNKFPVL